MMLRVAYLEDTFYKGDVTKQAVFYITNEIHVSIGSFKYTIFFSFLCLLVIFRKVSGKREGEGGGEERKRKKREERLESAPFLVV